MRIDELSTKEYFYGHKACGGCGGSLAVRLALKVLGDNTFAVLPAGCMSAVGFNYPQMCFSVNALIAPFASTGAMLSGVTAGAEAMGLKDYHVVGFAGDGGTADIGLQALSGAIDRHENIIYICYDNEAYMNTGIQQSGLTPYGAKTTTSPVGQRIHGSKNSKKNMFEIVAAHEVDYAATASIGYISDYINKVEKAKNTKGTSYIHVLAPCPTGWGASEAATLELAREAVDCGLWFLAEYENGEMKLNKKPQEFSSVEDYFKKQGRFKHLDLQDIEFVKKDRDKKFEKILKNYKYR